MSDTLQFVVVMRKTQETSELDPSPSRRQTEVCRPFSQLLLLVLLIASLVHGQESTKLIGQIEFYGYGGLNLEKVRAALPLQEGEAFSTSDDRLLQTIDHLKKEIQRVTGHPPTGVTTTCCNAEGNYIIYIGLQGNSLKKSRYNSVPKLKLRLPARVVNLYHQTNEASSVLVSKGMAAEDHSRGYALSNDANLRSKQLAIRSYALTHERLLRRVLRTSAYAEERIVAAKFLGYARQSRAQIADLVWASHDVDDGVRNDATRALGVLARSSAQIASQIPAAGFVEMLSSDSWTDRNKALLVIGELSRRRDSKLLRVLRSQALDALIEMARWRVSGHADSARIVLGRIGGIEEDRLLQMISAGNVEQIIQASKQPR